jgi:ribonuclease P protein component
MIKIARLKRRADFLAVTLTRRRHATPGLILQTKRQDGASAPRVGFTASRKVGIAVERNRARRRLKAVVAQVLGPHAASGTDYVVVARTGTLTRPFHDLATDLETAMRRLDAYVETAPR